MMLRISRAAHEAMQSLAASDPNHEVCGLLFGSGNFIDVMMAARNVASDLTRAFEIDPVALVAAQRDQRNGGATLAGYFHSHPNGIAQPSAADARNAAPDGKFWLIAADGALTAWRAILNGVVHDRFDPVLWTLHS